jgi:hypothetical protein
VQQKAAYDARVQEAMKQYKRAKDQRLIGAWLNAGITLAAAGISQQVERSQLRGAINKMGTKLPATGPSGPMPTMVATGGLIGYARGGLSDSVPALLTGGEYVMRKDVVDRYGVPFFNQLNQGQISRFAMGGVVGREAVSQTGLADQINNLFVKLTETLQRIEGAVNNTKGTGPTTTTENAGAVTNNITVNVTMNRDGSVSTESNTETKGRNQQEQEAQKMQQLGIMMAQVSRDTMIKESRPGGLLYTEIERRK